MTESPPVGTAPVELPPDLAPLIRQCEIAGGTVRTSHRCLIFDQLAVVALAAACRKAAEKRQAPTLSYVDDRELNAMADSRVEDDDEYEIRRERAVDRRREAELDELENGEGGYFADEASEARAAERALAIAEEKEDEEDDEGFQELEAAAFDPFEMVAVTIPDRSPYPGTGLEGWAVALTMTVEFYNDLMRCGRVFVDWDYDTEVPNEIAFPTPGEVNWEEVITLSEWEAYHGSRGWVDRTDGYHTRSPALIEESRMLVSWDGIRFYALIMAEGGNPAVEVLTPVLTWEDLDSWVLTHCKGS